MSDEKKKNKRILFIIIPVILILIALGVATYFLYPQIRTRLFPDSALSQETHANDTASAVSDITPDVTSGTDASTQKTSAEQTTGTVPETSAPESAAAATGDVDTSAPDETDPGTDAQTASEADTSAPATTNPETTGAPETSAAAATDAPETQHIHSYGTWTVIRQASCAEEGLKECKCTACGETLTESIAVLSHNYGDWTVTKTATCDAAGSKARTCKVCGKTETQAIAKLDHTYGSWTTTRQASCDVNGEQTRTCTKCGHVETKSIAATGHKWDKGTVSSSSGCGAGVKTYTCTVCGKTKTEKTSGANHTFGDWQYEEYTFDYTDRDQQYTATGRNKYHVCSKCGYKEYADIPQHACNLTFDYVILSEAHRCGDRFAGYTKEYCKTCGYVYAIVNEYDYVIEHMTNDRRVVSTVEYHIPYTQTTDEYFYYHSEEYCTACGKKTDDTHMSRDVRGMDIYDFFRDAQYYELGITNYSKRLHYYYELESNDNGLKYRIQLTTKYMPNGGEHLDDTTLRAHFETVPVARNLQIGYYNGQKCIVGYTAYWKSNGKTYSEYVDCTLSLKDVVKKYCASHIQRVCEDVPGFDFDAWWDAYRCSNEHPYLKSSGVLGYMMDGMFGIEWFCLSAEGDHLVFSGQHHTG